MAKLIVEVEMASSVRERFDRIYSLKKKSFFRLYIFYLDR